MRRGWYLHDARPEWEVIAGVGGAQLVKHLDGKWELRGGTAEDERALREWVERFLPEVAAVLPGPEERRIK